MTAADLASVEAAAEHRAGDGWAAHAIHRLVAEVRRAQAERDAYAEGLAAHIAHALGAPSPIAAIDRLDAAYVALRAVGWRAEGEAP